MKARLCQTCCYQFNLCLTLSYDQVDRRTLKKLIIQQFNNAVCELIIRANKKNVLIIQLHYMNMKMIEKHLLHG